MEKNTALEAMKSAATALSEAQALMQARVTEARAAGASWAAVGEILGSSKQAAQQKYGKPSVAAEIRASNAASKAAHDLTHADDQAVLAGYAAKRAAAQARQDKAAAASTTTSIFLDPIAPALRTQHRIPQPDTTAQPGIGKGLGPHLCPSCGSTNHKTENRGFAEFNADCVPTQYDPAKIAYLMWETNR